MDVQHRMLGGRYTLLEELGRGGMAVVWRARDEVLGRSVAVKVLAGRFADDPQSRARIRDEARAAATLSHPNIAQVYDFGESEVNGHLLPYVVMELVHGITLQQRVRTGMLAPRQIFRICAQVAAALAAAHADGLVHRDIKPGNVMVTQDGAKVVDFGIAAVAGPGDPADELLGTPAYLAPERLTGAEVQPASDVYALGVLMYRLLAGESPWTVDSTTQMLTAHVYVEPTPLRPLPEVPPEVTALVNDCLRKDPAHRPTAARVAGLLSAAEADQPAPAILPGAEANSAGAGGAAKRKKWVLAGGAATAAIAAAALLATFLPVGADSDATLAPPQRPSAAARTTTGSTPGTPATRPAGIAPAPTAAETAARAGDPPTPGSRPSSQPAPTSKPAPASKPAPTTAPTTAAPTTAPTSRTRTFSSLGGTVEARCTTATEAKLVSWAPKSPYKVERVSAGPVAAAVIVFKRGASRIRMTVTCVVGVPSVVSLPL